MRLRWGLVALALVAGACGSEDAPGEGESTADPSTTTTPATTLAPTTTIPLVPVDPGEVGTDGDTTPPTTADLPPPTFAPPPPPIPATTLAATEQPTVTEIGPGRPQWFSNDGATVVVADYGATLPASLCEGIGQPLLYRQPVGGDPRTLAVLGDNAAAFGVPTRPSPGRIAIAEGCLGSPLRLWAGDEAPNGVMARMASVPLSSPVTTAGLLTASADGVAFIGSTRAPGTGDPEVVRIDAESGQVTPLFAGEYLEVIELADDTYLARNLDTDEVRRLDADGTLLDSRSAGAMGASPDRSVAVTFTEQAIEVERIRPAGAAEVIAVPIPDANGDRYGLYQPVVLNDGTVVFTRRASRAHPVWELRPDGSIIELLPPDEWGDLVATSDGSQLASSRPAATPDEPLAEIALLIER